MQINHWKQIANGVTVHCTVSTIQIICFVTIESIVDGLLFVGWKFTEILWMYYTFQEFNTNLLSSTIYASIEQIIFYQSVFSTSVAL